MADEEHLAVLKQGYWVWNAWRCSNRRVLPDLKDADLERADLRSTVLISANLQGAYLRGASLAAADLSGANLFGANLEDADLRLANLSDQPFERSERPTGGELVGYDYWESFRLDHIGADLSEATLIGANLSGAKLDGANLAGAIVDGTNFGNCDLSKVKGLSSMKHWGPSTVGVDTVYRSQGTIPEAFLRDCGVPNTFIGYIPSLVNSEEDIQFYSCFISYSSKDEDFARRLHGRMRDARLRVWFAPEDIQGGKKLHEQIETAIRVYDKLLIVLSESSMQSEWVMDELRKAFGQEKASTRHKLFPLRLTDYQTLQRWECRDSRSGKDLAEEIRQYFIPDFSDWKNHDSFEKTFERLLRDLRSEDNVAAC